MATRTIQVDLPYPPLSGNRAVRHGRGGQHYKQAASRAYEALVLTRLDRLGLVGRRLAGPLQADFLVSPPDARARDADNLLKVVKDALTRARFWADDSNKVVARTTVEWLEPTPGGVITLAVRYDG